MKLERIKVLLPHLNSKLTSKRVGWAIGPCPRVWAHGGKDAHPSFAISDSAKKKSICKCLSCGFGGDLMDLLFDVSGHLKKAPASGYNLAAAAAIITSEFEDMEINPADIPDYETPVEKTEVVFPESILETFKSVSQFAVAMEYCADRGMSQEALMLLDVRYDPKQKRVCFPFRNFKGELMGIQGRYIGEGPCKDEDHPNSPLRYFQYGYQGKRNSHVWMGENTLNLDEPVVVLEGPFDFASVFRVYQNVAASFTSGLSKAKIRRLADAVEIVTFYDYGKGGNAARDSFTDILKGIPITHVIPTEQHDDAGNCSLEDVASYLQPHLKLSSIAF